MSAHVNLERRRQAIYGWLLLSPAAVLADAFCLLPFGCDTLVQPVLPRHPPQPDRVCGHRELRRSLRRSDFLARGRRTTFSMLASLSPSPSYRPCDGALGEFEDFRTRVRAHRLFHADRAADDRGGKPVALFLHAGSRCARPDRQRSSGCPPSTGWASPKRRSGRSSS